jgi:hypothetical protein
MYIVPEPKVHDKVRVKKSTGGRVGGVGGVGDEAWEYVRDDVLLNESQVHSGAEGVQVLEHPPLRGKVLVTW